MAYGGAGDATEIVDVLVTSLKKNFTDFKINEVIKAGSLGHGTAVPGHYDLDLVIYSDGITGSEVLQQGKNGFRPWLDKLGRFFKQYKEVSEVDNTPHSVQFKFRYGGHELEVDVLVSPYWKNLKLPGQDQDPHEFYKFLRTVPETQQSMFTVCASKWQVQFFQDQKNPRVKEYIRRAKAWRNRTWSSPGLGGKPKSYLLSLLVTCAYNRKGELGDKEVTRELISLVQNSESLSTGWETFYKFDEYRDLIPSNVTLLDPANPANDVWASGFLRMPNRRSLNDYAEGDGDSTLLKRYIHTLDLSQPLR